MTNELILSLDDSALGAPLPLGLEGLPTKDDSGAPIHYRRMKIATCGDWVHCGTGEKLDIGRERADTWIKNTMALAVAGRSPFISSKHVFSDPDAKDTLGKVLKVDRTNDDVYATVALHGDDALAIAARNGRSIGVLPKGRDAKGNTYTEFLHHLALVPNPALPDLGGTVQIAASADRPAITVPVFTLAAATPLPKESKMNKELISKFRTELGVAADVPDDKLPELAATRALELSASVKTLTTARDTEKTRADKAEQDRDTKASEVLALSADVPKRPDSLTMAMYQENISAKREAAVKSGLAETEAKMIDELLMDASQQPTALALSACGKDKKPLAFTIWSVIGKIAESRAGVTTTAAERDDAALALSAKDGKETPPKPMTAERKAEIMADAGYGK